MLCIFSDATFRFFFLHMKPPLARIISWKLCLLDRETFFLSSLAHVKSLACFCNGVVSYAAGSWWDVQRGPGSRWLASAPTPGCVSFIHLTSEARRRDESACRHKAGHVVWFFRLHRDRQECGSVTWLTLMVLASSNCWNVVYRAWQVTRTQIAFLKSCSLFDCWPWPMWIHRSTFFLKKYNRFFLA